jgi:hypothetical protein
MAQRKREAPPAASGGDPEDGEPPDERCFKLVFPYGFIDDNGLHRFWHSGQQVRDPDELELLRARGVKLED